MCFGHVLTWASPDDPVTDDKGEETRGRQHVHAHVPVHFDVALGRVVEPRWDSIDQEKGGDSAEGLCECVLMDTKTLRRARTHACMHVCWYE